MLVAGFPTGTFQANCYVLAPGPGGAGVIVDPGEGALAPLERVLVEHAVTPAAILATHGHVDHVHGAAEVARARDIPVWIHADDRLLLSEPARGLPADLGADVAGGLAGAGEPWREPPTVVELQPGPLTLAGLEIEVLATPGHTPGSVVFGLTTDEGGRLALTGDTVFAGSAGRTDMPGGDPAALQRSLRGLADTLTDDVVLLPGHGPSTTMGRERASNPFLAADQAATPEPVPGTPRRGRS